MLPFMNQKSMVASIVEKRGKKTAEVSPEVDAPDNEGQGQAESIAHAMLGAIERKSISELADAIKQIMGEDEEPEGETE